MQKTTLFSVMIGNAISFHANTTMASHTIDSKPTATIKRSDFSVDKWEPNVGDEVKIPVLVEATKD